MLSIKFVREYPEQVRENIKKKFQDHKLSLVDDVLALDEQYRGLLQQTEQLRATRNALSKSISEAKKKGESADELLGQAKTIPQEIKQIEEQTIAKKEALNALLVQLPNIMHADVPIGKSDAENVESKRWGDAKVPEFDVRNHAELIEALSIGDFDASARVAGNGFYYLFGDLVMLNQALLQYALKFMVDKGYTPVEPPLMINGKALSGVTTLAEREETTYKIDGQDLYLIATSEHPLISMFVDQQIDHTKLPIKLCGISPCFRQEIGSHGIDEKGIFRTHQFNKVEMIVICNEQDGWKFYEENLQHTIDIFTALDLPIRQLEICSGDLGDMKLRQADVEVWSPRRKEYFEVGSCSNLGDNQSMLLNIRVRHHEGNYYPQTLNNTAIATSRALVAILENNQLEDGRVRIPKLLQVVLGKEYLEAAEKLY